MDSEQYGEPVAEAAGLADLIRGHTAGLHREAERSGIVADLLQGRGSRAGYVLLLRNLLPAYAALEASLRANRAHPALAGIADPAVFRAGAIEADLHAMAGAGWHRDLPVLAAGQDYAQRIAEAAAQGAGPLLAHAYVRYLGDLNGGQILQRLLGRQLALPPAALAFHRFAAIPDLAAFRAEYRRRFDAAGRLLGQPQELVAREVLAEAAEAFRRNIALSAAVGAAAARAG